MHHETDLSSNLLTKLEWVTVQRQLGSLFGNAALLTESPQKEPFLFVSSVKPFQGLSLMACLQPANPFLTCWKNSNLSASVVLCKRSNLSSARRKKPVGHNHSGPWW